MVTLRWLVSLPFRVVGYVLMIAGFAAGFRDLWLTIKAEDITFTKLGDLWYAVSPETLNLAQAAIQRGVSPQIWDPGVIYLLGLPGWLMLLIIGTLTLLIAQLIYRPGVDRGDEYGL